jgi:DnaJ-class molecular chaperone
MYQAGVRHGAAYEHLRRSVIGDLVQCRACIGLGATKQEDTCTSCGGTGVVTLKA